MSIERANTAEKASEQFMKRKLILFCSIYLYFSKFEIWVGFNRLTLVKIVVDNFDDVASNMAGLGAKMAFDMIFVLPLFWD